MPDAELVELYASGLGIIDDAVVEFGPGLNVITGETGAGKTLLLGALNLCLGLEYAVERHAADERLRVGAIFRDRDGAEIVFSRERGSSGRLRSLINGATTSVEGLRALAEPLIVIHGQQDSLTLRQRGDVLGLIDTYGSVDTVDLRDTRRRLAEARELRDSFGGDSSARERELAFLDYQIAELESARLTSASELDDALATLQHWTAIRDGRDAIVTAVELLDGDHDGAILTQFARTLAMVPGSDGVAEVLEALRAALTSARTSVSELRAYVDGDVVDEATFESLERRVTLLQGIARKYGGTMASALSTWERLRFDREQLRAAGERLTAIDEEIRELERAVAILARRARQDRDFAASQLTSAVLGQLSRVALPGSSIRFSVDGDDGSLAELWFTPNVGRPEGPVQSLASGGELSRLLLAIALVTVSDGVVTVFDEVDAGIGGEVAQQIGTCLAELARDRQVLIVTHLASVAAKADQHFVIEKDVVGGRTVTTVREVRGDDRVNEIARMLTGEHRTTEARALATRLLDPRG